MAVYYKVSLTEEYGLTKQVGYRYQKSLEMNLTYINLYGIINIRRLR